MVYILVAKWTLGTIEVPRHPSLKTFGVDKVPASEDLGDRLCLSEVVQTDNTRVFPKLGEFLFKHSLRSVQGKELF